MPTIHIVEGDTWIREDSLRLLILAGFDCQAYPSAEQFLSQFDPQKPGCVILDLLLPGGDGLKLLEVLSQIPVPPPVIVICSHGDIRAAVRAVKGGALDFLETPFSEEDLFARVREAIVQDSDRCVLRREQSSVADRLASLTARECDVMDGLVAGDSAEQIGARFGLSTKTIYTHRSHLFVKTGVDSIASLTRLALQARIRPNSNSESKPRTMRNVRLPKNDLAHSYGIHE